MVFHIVCRAHSSMNGPGSIGSIVSSWRLGGWLAGCCLLRAGGTGTLSHTLSIRKKTPPFSRNQFFIANARYISTNIFSLLNSISIQPVWLSFYIHSQMDRDKNLYKAREMEGGIHYYFPRILFHPQLTFTVHISSSWHPWKLNNFIWTITSGECLSKRM